MTVDEAIKYVESAWVPGAAPTILAAEVRRLREAYSRQVDGTAELQTTLTRERDRYREALERIALLNPWSDIARDALKGGEE